jgi:hypothetical protein
MDLCCSNPIHIFSPEGYPVCISCGLTLNNVVFANNNSYDHNYYYIQKSIYKRKAHLLNKLYLIQAQKILNEDFGNNSKLMNIMRNSRIESIHDIYKTLEKNKLTAHNKHGFIIYYMLKRERIIKLSFIECSQIIKEFEIFNKLFIKKYPKKNMISYNFLLHRFSENLDLPMLKLVNLPKLEQTNNKIEEIYNSVINQ